jgi:DNA-binding transcriptional ArsR family regulator
VLRILFTGDDLARTRIAATVDPLWELSLGIQMLRPQRGDALFGLWRGRARAALRGAQRGPLASLLVALNPNVGYFPDFLTPSIAAHGIEAGLEAVRATPKAALLHDLAQLAATRALPAGARRLAAGESRVLKQLTTAMRQMYDIIIAPYGRAIDLAFAQEQQRRASAMAERGVEGLLTGLSPTMIWSHGELAIRGHREQELRLDGRGIRLIPSYFCVSGPLTLFDPGLPPVLVYPVQRSAETLPDAGRRAPALEALIGTTRTAVLEALSGGEVTTTDLARRTGISPASASEHTKVLRQAGLVLSSRDRSRMLHVTSGLGRALLTQNRTEPTRVFRA